MAHYKGFGAFRQRNNMAKPELTKHHIAQILTEYVFDNNYTSKDDYYGGPEEVQWPDSEFHTVKEIYDAFMEALN